MAEAWHWTFEDIKRIPYSRRRRAIRWHKTYQQKSMAAAKKDGSASFDELDVDYIWRAPLDVI